MQIEGDEMNSSKERAMVFEKDNMVTSKINTFLKERVSSENNNFIVEEIRTIEELSDMIVVYYKGFIKEDK